MKKQKKQKEDGFSYHPFGVAGLSSMACLPWQRRTEGGAGVHLLPKKNLYWKNPMRGSDDPEPGEKPVTDPEEKDPSRSEPERNLPFEVYTYAGQQLIIPVNGNGEAAESIVINSGSFVRRK